MGREGLSVYLVDDRGRSGEYYSFLGNYAGRLPISSVEVFTNYRDLMHAVGGSEPDLIMADMQFDMIPRGDLYGDIEGLAATDRFGGNLERAEAQVRGLQGLLICRALRESGIGVPIILFASLAPKAEAAAMRSLAPLRIIRGLILGEIREAVEELAGAGVGRGG